MRRPSQAAAAALLAAPAALLVPGVAAADDAGSVTHAAGDGRPELVGQDPVFSGAFTAFAASAFPPLVLHVRAGKLVDVTKRFPALVRKDAAARLKDLRKAKKGDDVRGGLAAYVADEYLLGKASAAQRELAHQRKARRITASFKPYLLKKLHAWGYR